MSTELRQKPLSRLERASGYHEVREQLKQTKRLGQVLQQAESYALQVFPTFASEIPQLDIHNPKLPGVLLLGNYQGVEQTSSEYGTLLQAKSLRQKIAREVVRDIISDPESQVAISPEQRILLKHGLQIQDVVDDLHIAWHKELIQGPHAEVLKHFMENDAFLSLLLGEHGDFLYGFARKEDNGVRFHTYANAYPEQIATISRQIDNMVTDLTPLAQQGSDEAKAHIAVHTAWQKLLTYDGNAKEQEALGKALDVTWMTQADANNPAIRSQVLYPMEAYTSGKSVEWQYDILLKQPEYDAINADCDQTKKVMQHLFQTDPDFAQLSTLQESLAILEPN